MTISGILIGIFSVVILIALGLGLKKYIEDTFKSLGSNLAIVMPGEMFVNGQLRNNASGVIPAQFDEKDLRAVSEMETTQISAAGLVKNLLVKGDSETKNLEVIAATEDIFSVLNFELDKGKLFTKKDLDKKAKVAVLGSEVGKDLYFDTEAAIGKKIKIDNQFYKIIGSLKSKGAGGIGGASIDDRVYIPFSSAQSFNPDNKYLALYAKTFEDNDLEIYKKNITEVLLETHEEDEFSVLDQKEIFSAFTSIINILNLVLVAIATISLVVGGVGIMNIMYISVAERIKEIGIRRAYGATRNDILYLFIFEAVILSLIGGSLAIILSYATVLLIKNFFPAYIDLNAVLLSLGVSSLIGIIFGVLPARKASLLTPIEAIRRE